MEKKKRNGINALIESRKSDEEGIIKEGRKRLLSLNTYTAKTYVKEKKCK